jgi:ABC-2 type transport system permease protein
MFRKLFATIAKDLLLLWRDRAGLLVLFVMPAVLVVIITLVQDNVYKLMGETAARVVLVDQDRGELGRQIAVRLRRVELIDKINGAEIVAEQAVALVAAGDYQACIIIRTGTTARLLARAEAEVGSSLGADPVASGPEPELEMLFDPTVMGGFRAAMQNGLALVLLEFEVRTKLATLSRLLPEFLAGEMRKAAGDFAEYVEVPALALTMSTEPLLKVRAGAAARAGGLVAAPTPVQHNVPAWALFGVFFIVVPMAGSLIKERQEETLARLLTMPVPYAVILAGKVIAYVLVCCGQFTLIFLLGRFVLPLFGVEAFRLGTGLGGGVLVVLAASLAATGYGIMLGTISRTYEQASMFGAISVVAASAIGGVMVPVYAMPAMMQKISVISPIGWGLEAFLDIFVRGGDLGAVLGELSLLLLFAVATVSVAGLIFARRAAHGF